MSEQQPKGIYVYQPFGSVTHPDRDKTGRLFGLGGLPIGVECKGLTREEADAFADALNGICWMTDRCHACGRQMRFMSSACSQCGEKAAPPLQCQCRVDFKRDELRELKKHVNFHRLARAAAAMPAPVSAAPAPKAEKCPSCESPAPHLHPAMQFEGEVQMCKDAFHQIRTPQNEPFLPGGRHYIPVDPPSGSPRSHVSEEADRITEQEMRADAVEPSAGTSMASFQAQVGETRSRTIRAIVAHPLFALAREFRWDDRQLEAAKKMIDITVIRLEELASSSPAEEREKMMADKTGQVPTDAEVDEDVQRDRKLDHSRANPDGCSDWCRDCEARLSCRNNRHEWPNDYSDGDTCFCGAFYLFANTVDERPHVIQSQAEDR